MPTVTDRASTFFGRVRGALGLGTKSRTSDITIPAPWTDRDAAVLGNGLTPASLTGLILRRNEGYLRAWADLADHARRTFPALHWELATREQSVQETDFEVIAGEGSNKRGANRAADACRELFASWQSVETAGSGAAAGWSTWVAEFVASVYYPAGAHEVTWIRDGALIVPISLQRLAERRLSYACDRFDSTPWSLRVWDEGDSTSPFNRMYGIPLDEFHADKFLIHRRRVVGGNPAAEGLFSVLVWFWLFGVWSWRDLMALLEMLGRPPTVAYYNAGGAKAARENAKMDGPRNATLEEVAAADAAVKGLTGALRATLPDTVHLESLQYELPTTTPIQLLTSERIEKYIAKVVNATDGVSTIVPGSRASQEVAMEQSRTPWRGDCRYAARQATILFARFIRANPDRFGANCPLPILVAKIDPPKDLKSLAETLEIAKRTGVRIPEAWAHEALQIPIPGNAERVIGDAIPGAAPAPVPGAPAVPAGAFGSFARTPLPSELTWRQFVSKDDAARTQVCTLCEGVRLPAGHPWWRTHVPPLHFGCRSHLELLTSVQAHERGGQFFPQTAIDAVAPVGFGDGNTPVSADTATVVREILGLADTVELRHGRQTFQNHRLSGIDVQRAIARGEPVHVFFDTVDIGALEREVWRNGRDTVTANGWTHRQLTLPDPIGERIDPRAADDAPRQLISIAEIKYRRVGERVEFHLVPRHGGRTGEAP